MVEREIGVRSKEILDDQGKAFDEFKKANDELIKAKAEGKAVSDLEGKVAKLSEELDKLSLLKDAIDAIEKKMAYNRTRHYRHGGKKI